VLPCLSLLTLGFDVKMNVYHC